MTGAPATAPPRATPAGAPRRARARAASTGFGATCPACGGTIRIADGDRSVRCGYCRSAFFVTEPRGVRSFILPSAVTAARARLAAIRCIDERTDGRIGARNTTILEERLIHVPFWRLRGRLMGWIAGRSSRMVETRAVPDDPSAGPAYPTVNEEREAFSRLVFKRVDWSAPACVLPCLGLQGIALRTEFLDWQVLDDAERASHTVALPTRSEGTARRDALAYLTGLAVPARATVLRSRFHLFESAFSLYYYPVRLIRYACAGRTYTITIDGRSGVVVHGEVPAAKRRDLRRVFFVPAVLAFLAGTWWPLAPACVGGAYLLDSIAGRRLLPPFDWLATKTRILLGGEG